MTTLARREAVAEIIRPRIPVRLEPELTSRALMDALLCGNFTVHGETCTIGQPVDWSRNPSIDLEWHIVLHKFFHAPGLVQAYTETGDRRYLDLLQDHILSWIDTMDPGFIAADVTGRRIRNWIYALRLYLDAAGDEVDCAFLDRVEISIAHQTTWLWRNLHPDRNHRTLELFAIFMAGIWLGDTQWTNDALNSLTENAVADFLPDGVHVELSSHYHCIVLRNFIELRNIADTNAIALPDVLNGVIEKASHFARVLHKPDGQIPALSDADTGDYRSLIGPGKMPRQLEIFPDAGYVFMRDAAAAAGARDGAYLVFDCGPLGAGNHGHLDCLSVEFAAMGRSLIVDPGRFTYFEGGSPNERAAFRATAAHNLVQVDGRDQTAYRQGPKRMKIAGPAPVAEIVSARPGRVHGRARSTEYDVVLDRIINAHPQGWWLVWDMMTAPSDHSYDLHYQLSPEADGKTQCLCLDCGTPAILTPNLLVVPLASSPLTLEIEDSWVAPAYGIRHRAPRLHLRQSAASGWYATLLIPFRDRPPEVKFMATSRAYAVTLGDHPTVHGVIS